MPVLSALCEYKRSNSVSLKCSVYMASKKRFPVIVHLHGGALIGGNRFSVNRHHLNRFLREGYSVVSIDYRLAPETKLPYIVEDVRDALLWVAGEGAQTFGYDADRMGVYGGSAGGYLSLTTGTMDVKPKVIVSYYGYGDLLGDWYCKPDPFYCAQPSVTEEEAYEMVGKRARTFGGGGRFYLFCRQNGLWTSLVSGWDIVKDRVKIEKYCPILNITDEYPPTILLHGDNDTDVPYEQSVDMYNALKAKGIPVEMLTCEGGGHGFDTNINDPKVMGIFNRVLQFVKEHI